MNDSCKKRIAKEIELIESKLPTYQIGRLHINDEKKQTHFEIITPNYNTLTFILPNDYPFKPPIEVKWKGQNYRYILKNMPKRIEYLYYHQNDMYVDEKYKYTFYKKPECLCCNSLLCADNWSPVMTLHRILDEIIHHNELKRYIMYKLKLKEFFEYYHLPLELFRTIYKYL